MDRGRGSRGGLGRGRGYSVGAQRGGYHQGQHQRNEGGQSRGGNIGDLAKAAERMRLEDDSSAARPSRGRGVRGARAVSHYDCVRTRPSSLSNKMGTSGQPIQLVTNYLGFQKKPSDNLFKYRVDFLMDALEETETYVKKKIFGRLTSTLPPFLFDGTMAYFPVKLSSLEFTSAVEVKPGTDKPVQVKLKMVGELSSTDNDYVHFYNMIKQRAIEKLGLKWMKGDYFDPAAGIEMPEWQITIWPGYRTTIRQHERELLLGFEVVHKLLRTDSAYSTIQQVVYRYGTGEEAIRAIKRALIGAIVISCYNNKTYRIDDVDFGSNPMSTFPMKDGSTISFKDYYEKRYGLQVKDLKQPLLISMPKDKDRRRGDMQAVKIIPEFTQMTGLTDEQRANFKMTQALSAYTRMVPSKRIEALQKFARRMTTVPEVRCEWEKWGLKLDPTPKQLKGRLLNPEVIYLKKEFNYRSQNADWTNGLRDGMLESKQISRIAIVVAQNIEPQARQFWDECSKLARPLNVVLTGPPLWLVIPDARSTSYVSAIAQQIYPKKPDICVVMVPKVDEELYATLKKLMCIKCPMISQVITAQKVLNKADKYRSFATKILVQMATKLGAKPWALKIPPKNVMVAGFDTYHKKEGDRRGQSFGAFTASLDPIFGRYFSQSLPHSAGEEISHSMAVMFAGALKAYQNANDGCLPQKIFFYRDGVGEGMLHEVKETEVKAIKAVIEATGADIKLSFIIVSKRINTRFYATSGSTVQNPPSGTIVDDVATLPERYDFFLISQSVNQGTVSPTNYNVILDESGWAPDKVQALTYKLTHLYFNWTGTVRVPAPCMYAHKLADLVGSKLKEDVSPELTNQNVLYYL